MKKPDPSTVMAAIAETRYPAPVDPDAEGLQAGDVPHWQLEAARIQAETRKAHSEIPTESYRPVGGISIPPDVFPVPTDGTGWLAPAEKIFRVMGATEPKRVFFRGHGEEGIVEIVEGKLMPITPDRFCSLVEEFGHRVAKREPYTKDGTELIRWRKGKLSSSNARGLLASTPARHYLPFIRQVFPVPIITPEGIILGPGWHPDGSFVTGHVTAPSVPLGTAKRALLDLLSDFEFATPSDKSRAFASLLSPAMRAGGWIRDDFPLDVAEADQSQSGKTYRQKVAIAIYGGDPAPVTVSEGGVGSLDESIATELIRGNPFVILDNVRGTVASQVFESAIRGHGKVACRALRTSAEVETGTFNWYLSTNGANLTRDLANRSIITRIKRRARTRKFRAYPEGTLIDHVRENQAFYLGSVFAILKEWARLGHPQTEDHRHDFRGWCQSMDYIVQRIVGLPPLLDGHESEQLRVGNPDLQWLRSVAMAPGRRVDAESISASEIAELVEDEAIPWPSPSREPSGSIRVGRILAKLFRESDGEPITVDGWEVAREITERVDDRGHRIPEKRYKISRG